MPEELRGWKDIGAHFGTSDRTAQRWERDHGLPVRRTGRTRGASVFAFVHELDAWRVSPAGVRADSENGAGAAATVAVVRDRPRARRLVPYLGVGLLLVAGAAWAVRARQASDVWPSKVVSEAYAVPRSPLVFLLKVTRDDGTPFLFHVLDGGMATLAVRDGVKLGFVPVMGATAANLLFVRIAPASDGEAVRELKRTPLSLGLPVHFDHPGMTVDLEWTGTVESSERPSVPQEKPRHCCLVAGAVTACAARVSVSSAAFVGSCCGYDGCRAVK